MKHSYKLLPLALATLIFLGGGHLLFAQQSNLTCSQTNVPFVNSSTPSFTVTRSSSSTGLSTWANTANVIDNNLANSAAGIIALSGGLSLSVTDASNTYNAGDFAGFVLGSGVLSLTALGSVTISTYNGATLQESVSSSSLIAINSSITGAYEVGFYTNKPFTSIHLDINAALGLATYNVYYAFLRGTGSCTSAPLQCNTYTNVDFPNFGAVANPARTGTTGVTLGSVTNPDFIVDTIANNYATISPAVAILASAFISVRDVANLYPPGTFAGFDIDNGNLVSVSALNNISIKTYRHDTLKQSFTGSNLAVGAGLLSSANRQRIGFVVDSSFDEVQLVLNQPVGVTLGATKVYSAIFKKFCAGPPLICNTPTSINDSLHPVYINGLGTGITGALCAACSISNSGNVIDGNDTTHTDITLTASTLVTASLAVKNAIASYPAGTFVGFDIENSGLATVSTFLNNIALVTYRHDTLQESFTGSAILAGASSSLLGNSSRMTLGAVSTHDFDEARIILTQTVGVNLGTTSIYNFVLTKFCDNPLACRSTNYLTNPTYPVYIDQQKSGLTGPACLLCAVTNAQNVINADTSKYGTITSVASILSTSSLAVKNAVSVFPAKSYAGFTVQELTSLVKASLLSTITISTYKNGVLRESKSAGSLLDLTVIIDLTGTNNSNTYSLGFATTMDYDEVQISVTPVLGVAPTLRVYNAYIGTQNIDSLNASTFCHKPPTAEPDHISTIENFPVVGSVRTNDSDPDSGILNYNPTLPINPTHGTVVMGTNGQFTYTPNPGFVGVDSFEYSVCNAALLCTSQWAYVSVIPNGGGANHPPIAESDFGQTLVATPVSGNIKSNDIDPDGDSLSYSNTIGPKHGMLTLLSNGKYTYTPDSSFIGNDTAINQVCDNGTPSLCVSSMLILQVTPGSDSNLNNPPFAQDDVASVLPHHTLSGNVLGNDSDPDGDILSATFIDTVAAAAGTFTWLPDGSYTFVPTPGYSGSFVLRYAACDGGTPSLCDTASLSITVQAVPPLAEPDHLSTNENYPISGTVSTNDSDPNSGVLNYNPTLSVNPNHGIAVMGANGQFTYTPDSGFVGIDSFNYTVCNASTLCTNQWAYVSVIPNRGSANHPPVAQADYGQTLRATPVSGDISSNDIDPDGDSLSYSNTIGPKHGSLMLLANGKYTYTPDSSFIGNDTAINQVCDNGTPSLCVSSMLILQVTPRPDGSLNNPPFAQDDVASVLPFHTLSGNVLLNDSDPDGDILSTTFLDTVASSKGIFTWLPDGSYTFVPAIGYEGSFVLRYMACDGGSPSFCDTASLSITAQLDSMICLKARVYLEGALINNGNAIAIDGRPLMRDNLRQSPFTAQNFIPVKDPYEFATPFISAASLANKYTKLAPQNSSYPQLQQVTDSAAVFGVTGDNAIVDWVFVELRNKSNSATVQSTRAALLQRDGDIVDVDGKTCLAFPGVPIDSYYVAVRHRSHLGTMTKFAQSPDSLKSLIDFTVASTGLYDKGIVGANDFTGLSQKANVKGTYRAMWQGDFGADKKIKYDNPNDDLSTMLFETLLHPVNINGTTSFNFAYGYMQGDYDMNTKVKFDNPNDDNSMLLFQELLYPINTNGTTGFDFFLQQLP